MPEWLKGADCKSASESLRWFESISTHQSDFQRLKEPKGSFFVRLKKARWWLTGSFRLHAWVFFRWPHDIIEQSGNPLLFPQDQAYRPDETQQLLKII